LRSGRGKLLALVLTVVLLLAAAGAGTWWLVLRPRGDPAPVARAYLDAWERADWAGMQRLVAAPPADFADQHRRMLTALGVRATALTQGPLRQEDDRADAAYTAQLDLRGLGRWTYQGSLRLVRRDRRTWKVDWSPAAIHPQLGPGKRLARTRSWPPRAPILASDGGRLADAGEEVLVGVVGSRVKDRGLVGRALVGTAGADQALVSRTLDRAAQTPGQFLPVLTLPMARYQEIRATIHPVPGLSFQVRSGRRVAGPASAALLIGQVGEATADDLKELGVPYQQGDRVGHGGFEAAFERQLAGAPGGEVRLVEQPTGDGATSQEAAPLVLYRFPAEQGSPVHTTLDPRVLRAAEKALVGVAKPAALVALKPSTGEVRAVVNWPLGGSFNRAMVGRYPPGSTFKVVTAAALLGGGLKPGDRVTCPPRAVVGGRPFRNFEGEALGPITFTQAFAHSCNTAFVQLAGSRLDGAKLAEAAGRFGFETELSPGLPAITGRFPRPDDDAGLAAAAIGQGRVVTSPLLMAGVAGAVQNGSWHPPRLAAEAKPAEPRPLGLGVAASLRGLMQAVVREGTAAPAHLPGGTGGKTGTAEFGTGNPLPTHAWFVGFRGDLAFAVVVEGGGVGGRVAAPIAGRFLTALG
jgi:Penicillin binding protein transpeptidase domain/Penicillin-binding Protein dimerisation domain/NTF2-like N-terminal transpeptidase domain